MDSVIKRGERFFGERKKNGSMDQERKRRVGKSRSVGEASRDRRRKGCRGRRSGKKRNSNTHWTQYEQIHHA